VAEIRKTKQRNGQHTLSIPMGEPGWVGGGPGPIRLGIRAAGVHRLLFGAGVLNKTMVKLISVCAL